jgi:hypothetical protein
MVTPVGQKIVAALHYGQNNVVAVRTALSCREHPAVDVKQFNHHIAHTAPGRFFNKVNHPVNFAGQDHGEDQAL